MYIIFHVHFKLQCWINLYVGLSIRVATATQRLWLTWLCRLKRRIPATILQSKLKYVSQKCA